MAKCIPAIIILIALTVCTTEAICTVRTVPATEGMCLFAVSAHIQPVDHDRAVEACRIYGGKLPAIKTRAKEKVFRDFANEIRVGFSTSATHRAAIYVWINLQRDRLPELSDGTNMTLWRQRESWRWKDDNSSISDEMWNYWDELHSEPSNNFEQFNDYCVLAKVKAEVESVWRDAACLDIDWYDCDYPMAIICEKRDI